MRNRLPKKGKSQCAQLHLSGPFWLLVHDRAWVYLGDGFRNRWAVAQSSVWLFRVVVIPPLRDQDLGFARAVIDFTVQELIAEPGIEALTVSVFLWGAGFDVCGLCANRLDPVLDRLGDELWPVARPNERRHASQDEQVTQDLDHVARVQPSINTDRQAFPGIRVDDVRRPKRVPIIGPAMREVVTPNVVATL